MESRSGLSEDGRIKSGHAQLGSFYITGFLPSFPCPSLLCCCNIPLSVLLLTGRSFEPVPAAVFSLLIGVSIEQIVSSSLAEAGRY